VALVEVALVVTEVRMLVVQVKQVKVTLVV
jgi:hypothetical protein